MKFDSIQYTCKISNINHEISFFTSIKKSQYPDPSICINIINHTTAFYSEINVTSHL